MIYKMITSKAVIAKIIADLALEEDKIKITDIKSWIGEAINKIGSVNQYDNKVCILKLKDYQAKLPCDLESINFVAYASNNDGGWIPMKKSTGAFSVYDKIDNNGECNMLIQDEAIIPIIKNLFGLDDNKKALEILNKDWNIRQTLSTLINDYTFCSPDCKKGTNFSNTVQYDIKPGYMFSNVRNGYVKLSYIAQYVDEEGMPLIPDNQSYFEAIYWYVAMKLLYIEYYTGRKPQHLYYDAKRSWNFYRQQAYAESLLPNQNELENIKNTWHTLIPEYDSYDMFFSTTGDEQKIYNWNR